jgi:thioredoxin reductase
MNRYEITAVHRDEGSVVLFEGQADPEVGETGSVQVGRVLIAVDHRPAQDLVSALENGDEPVFVTVEPWQIVGTLR